MSAMPQYSYTTVEPRYDYLKYIACMQIQAPDTDFARAVDPEFI